ncbi:ROK family protein [Paenibacillus sp. D2_2]|uniref:ROK family protein n=1 Tax=Paenibacillus sp. D2_2 TaxID=3073092 RepID=UPI0028158EF9|nr:ROK family protein [Paenibacillus sp. D2_2]WMT41286.1 ROK family protein [Paenibacillus sp. D2_2]
MKRNIVIALDVGGTFIKSCIMLNHVPIPASQKEFPSLADQDKETIIEQFIHIFKYQVDFYHSQFIEQDSHWHIGLAFPGPFDYEQGICYIQGLEKFESLYGFNVKRAFYERLAQEQGSWVRPLQSAEIRFENDARLFALGFSTNYPQDRFIALTLGTGLGSAFIDKSTIIDHFVGIPANGWLYNQPYRDGIIDDAFSKRGILQLAHSLGVMNHDLDVKELAEDAIAGDVLSREVFTEFGTRLADMLIPYIQAFQPNLLVFGGQLSKSFHLFSAALQGFADLHQIQIHTSERMLENTFLGISHMFRF